MGFAVNREIVAGNTLIAEAIQSQNFTAGSQGWAIFADGSYEFGAGGTIRGNVAVKGADGSEVDIIATSGARINFTPPTTAGVTTTAPGDIRSNIAQGGSNYQSFLTIESPTINAGAGNISRATLVLDGKNSDGSANPGFVTPRTLLEFNGDALIHGDLHLDDSLQIVNGATIGGVLVAANRLVGNVTITPSAANVPTSAVITFPATLKGTSFACQTSANTSAPGTNVTEVSFNSLSSTSVTIWLTRTNTNPTTVSYTVEGF